MYICAKVIYFFMSLEYHKDTTHISKSGLDLIHQAPAKYHERYLNPSPLMKEKREKQLVIGSAFHSIVLEPHKFQDEFFIMPTMSGIGSEIARKKLIQENIGKNYISLEEYQIMLGMKESIYAHPIASQLLDVDGMNETRFDWVDPDTGVKCKIKPDHLNFKKEYCVDLKTTKCAKEGVFDRSAFDFRYHVQDAFYLDGLEANGIKMKTMAFIAVEKEPPFLVNTLFFGKREIEVGRRTYKKDLAIYAECLATNQWPGYEQMMHLMGLPEWAYNE